MDTKATTEGTVLAEKVDVLIAIGAATAANCIPCFEHLYEKAVTSGITPAEIKRASQISEMVKKGAHTALSSSIDELIGSKDVNEGACGKTAVGSCAC